MLRNWRVASTVYHTWPKQKINNKDQLVNSHKVCEVNAEGIRIVYGLKNLTNK